MRQLDDGIGDTLVSVLEVLGNGRSRYQITLTDLGTADAAIATDRHGPQIDVISRHGNRLGRTLFHGA